VAAVLGVTALGLAACGPGGATATGGSAAAAGQTAVEVAADLSLEGQALAALGFPAADLEPVSYPAAATPEPSASASGERARPGWRKRHLNRVLLRRNTLHGEVVVQTKDGTKTVLVQRGEVTAINDDTMTVKSTDGFTLTWTFGDPIRVVERRNTVQPKDIAVGTKVGVAGTKDGNTSTAKLIVVPMK
jgi:hypothetical protein